MSKPTDLDALIQQQEEEAAEAMAMAMSRQATPYAQSPIYQNAAMLNTTQEVDIDEVSQSQPLIGWMINYAFNANQTDWSSYDHGILAQYKVTQYM